MDTKFPPPSTEDAMDQPPPPSYSAATATTLPTPSSPFHPSSLTSHLHAHLSALPSRIQATQESRSLNQSQTDTYLLDRLVPHIESFLGALGTRHPTPHLATLTLVPAAAVPANAQLSELEDMRRRGEFGLVCRVDDSHGSSDEKTKQGASSSATGPSLGEQTWSTGREFTDWGRWDEGSSSDDPTRSSTLWWWRDEPTARRLASYLQPLPARRRRRGGSSSPASSPTIASNVQKAVERAIPAEKKRGWDFGFRRGSAASSPSATTVGPTSTSARGTVAGGDVAGAPDEQPLPDRGANDIEEEERAEMNVSAQEVAFRQENEFGIWESTSGWAIVVQVKVRA